jgi:hypothetical protein
VKRSGHQDTYSRNSEFAAFIRCLMGLPMVPLDRLQEGIDNIRRSSRQLNGELRGFARDMIRYINSTWVNGAYRPAMWNMYRHQGATTNNYAEGLT